MLYYLCNDHWTLPGPYLQKTLAITTGWSMHYCCGWKTAGFVFGCLAFAAGSEYVCIWPRGYCWYVSVLLWAYWYIPIGYAIHIWPKMELGARVFLGHGLVDLLIDLCWFLTFRDLFTSIPCLPIHSKSAFLGIWLPPFGSSLLLAHLGLALLT